MASGHPSQPDGIQLFGLFASRYFLFALFSGFIISRIQVLVSRQRVRPLHTLARIALYAPCHMLLLRAVALMCAALDQERQDHQVQWMHQPISYVARQVTRQWGDKSVTPESALWLVFATTCAFDCMEVFISRLEGSPCSPYEHIGNLMERTSLYYFYGGSVRIHELALLNALERSMLSHLLILVSNGWQWRLVPTAIASLLMLHHFLFSMQNAMGLPVLYPFVQVLSMALLGVSLIIVLATVAIRWLAHLVDRFGMRHGQQTSGTEAAVARYDREGAFLGPEVDAEDRAVYELEQDMCLPLHPDWRRDFSVEILDLAGTCLKQYSTQIRSSGYARPCGAMRLPKATVVDEYVERFRGKRSGFAVYVEDEPSIMALVPPSPMDLVMVIKDTRVGSLRRLSVELWSLCTALFEHGIRRTKAQRNRGSAKSKQPLSARHNTASKRAPCNSSSGDEHCRESNSQSDAGSKRSAAIVTDSDDDFDYDYVYDSSNSSSDDDDDSEWDFMEDNGGVSTGLLDETAGLVSDIIGDAAGQSARDRLSAAMIFMAHSLFDGYLQQQAQPAGTPAVLTRGMYAQRLASMYGGVAQLLPSSGPMPLSQGEMESLAQLIRSKRRQQQQHQETADKGGGNMLCVICWTNTRCVMLRPCRCLCLCNECRMSLAMRRFEHCPCCRRDVAGYSRVFAV
ncbi:hypothetical protein GQ54DRAFT_254261 [Martensiomyces pterosporus]|nr:hypothetical protein GQ54DRAFT_254261 [Martensiomyces pterosporus]